MYKSGAKALKYLLVIGLVMLVLVSSGGPASAKISPPSAMDWLVDPFTSSVGGTLLNSKYASKVVDRGGRELYRMVTPVKPPETKVPAVEVPQNSTAGVLSLGNVPAFDWSYGCSATSAAMMFGYYDRTGYPNIYTGPTNSGVTPMTNSVWGHTAYPGATCGESPLSATHNGVDGRATRGHVDDYWIDYGNTGPDPYIVNSWTEHSPLDSAGDFMGTNQSKYSSMDGSTSFYYEPSGAPLSDYTGNEPEDRDGCHGMRLFAESRGYTVLANFTQLIRGKGSNPVLGFTFANYCSEIDAGRPVLIQVNGHTMLGDGYNTIGNLVYLHDTWDYSDHQMTWGGSYSGMAQWGVTVLLLLPASPASITLTSPNGGENWMVGESRAIQWSSFGLSSNVAIELSRNGGSAWETLFSDTANDGSESWTVGGTPSGACRVRVTSIISPGVNDASDGNFTISGTPSLPLAIGSISATPNAGISSWNPVTIRASANRSGNWTGTVHHPSGIQIGILASGSGIAYSATWAPTVSQNFCGSGFYAMVQVTVDGETRTSTVAFATENYPVKIVQTSLADEAFQPIANPKAGQAFFVVIGIKNSSTGSLSSVFAPVMVGDRYIGAGGFGNLQPGQQASSYLRCGGLTAGSFINKIYVWVNLGGYPLALPIDFPFTVLP